MVPTASDPDPRVVSRTAAWRQFRVDLGLLSAWFVALGKAVTPMTLRVGEFQRPGRGYLWAACQAGRVGLGSGEDLGQDVVARVVAAG